MIKIKWGGFQVLMAASLKMTLWHDTPCSQMEVYRRLEVLAYSFYGDDRGSKRL
jgi:hypothetical protein